MAWLSVEQIHDMGFASLGQNLQIDDTVTFYRCSSIRLGSFVRIDARAELVAGPGDLVIGNHVHVSRGCVIHGQAGIVLEDFVGLSPSVHLLTECDDYSAGWLTNPTVDREFRRVTSLPIRLGRHVAVGTSSVILPGSRIGEGASIGALSVVLGRVLPGAIMSGNPIVRTGTRNIEKLRRNEESLRQKKR